MGVAAKTSHQWLTFFGGLLVAICGLAMAALIAHLGQTDKCGPIFDTGECFAGPPTLRWSLVALGEVGSLCWVLAGVAICRRARQSDETSEAWLVVAMGMLLAGLSIGAFVGQGASLP